MTKTIIVIKIIISVLGNLTKTMKKETYTPDLSFMYSQFTISFLDGSWLPLHNLISKWADGNF